MCTWCTTISHTRTSIKALTTPTLHNNKFQFKRSAQCTPTFEIFAVNCCVHRVAGKFSDIKAMRMWCGVSEDNTRENTFLATLKHLYVLCLGLRVSVHAYERSHRAIARPPLLRRRSVRYKEREMLPHYNTCYNNILFTCSALVTHIWSWLFCALSLRAPYTFMESAKKKFIAF